MEERQVKYVYNTNLGGSSAVTAGVLSVAESSNTVSVNPAKITIGSCPQPNVIIQDSGTAAPLAGAITTPCVEGVAGHTSSALPATSDTVDVYFGDGASVVDGPHPLNIIYAP